MKTPPGNVLALLFAAALFVGVAPRVSAQNKPMEGQIPNECCPQPSANFWIDGIYGDLKEAGVGETVVTPQGTAERKVLSPLVADGLSGAARLYSRLFVVDITSPDASSTLKSSIPVPDMSAASLTGGGLSVQPRPGTMPGLYLYTDGEGSYYVYGGPLNTGPNPMSTAVYSNPTTVGGGNGGDGGVGDAGPSSEEVSASLPKTASVYTNDISGAQLWRYQGRNPYFEVKHVDGSVARYDFFDPWGGSGTGEILHVTSVRDPYDNTATYNYDASHRLISIEFPSGLTQRFDWSPNWGSWGANYDLLEITYDQDRFDSQPAVALSDLTWGIAFNNDTTAGLRHFGSSIRRIYSSSRPITEELFGSPYTSPPATVTGQIVYEFDYVNSAPDYACETQRVNAGTSFAPSFTAPAGLVDRVLLKTFYGGAGSTVSLQYRATSLETLTFTYPAATRSTDLLTGASLSAIRAVDASGTTHTMEYDVNDGRLYSVIIEPSSDFVGQPRKTHASTDNSGIGGVAASDVEPDRYEIYNVFDATCVCQKPIERQIRSTVGGATTTRTTKFVYDSATKLVLERHVPNPEVGPASPAQYAVYKYKYLQAATSSQDWGAWLIEEEETPDGTWVYAYSDWLNRIDAQNHGRIAGTVTKSISSVREQDTLSGAAVTFTSAIEEVLHRNLSNSPGGNAPSPGSPNVVGQPREVVDGDGVETTFEYTAEGWPYAVQAPTGRTVYVRDAYAAETQVTQRASAVGVAAAVWTVTPLHALRTASERVSASASATRKSQLYFDRYGHVAVQRRWNKSSSNGAPARHGVASSSAREWVDTQWHYMHTRIDSVYRDAQPLDEAFDPNKLLVTEYVYGNTTTRLEHVINPNGSKTYYDFDAFGTLYRANVENAAGTETVRGPKRFISPFLEVTGRYEYTDSDHLWTLMDRNTAGSVTRLVEPSLQTAPTGYTPANGIDYSTGGAEHTFEVDKLGRVTAVETTDGASTPVVLARRSMEYDQLSRLTLRHDEAMRRDTTAADDRYTSWQYEDGKISQLDTMRATGLADTTYSYYSSGLLEQVLQGGDKVEYEYFAGTPFRKSVERTDFDPLSTSRQTKTTFDVDAHGQVTKVIEGALLPSVDRLDHEYAFNSFGLVDGYADPAAKAREFLHDALGRSVEHVRVGSSSFIRNTTEYDDLGSASKTTVKRLDDRGNETITHFDFAGRPYIVQNPGAPSTLPTSATPQSLSTLAAYDGASRIVALYDGDGGKTVLDRDGRGRVIRSYLESQGGGSDITIWNALDWYRRDALGRVEQNDYYSGIPGFWSVVGVGARFADSTGRTHLERYQFAIANGSVALGHVIEVESQFVGGNPYREGLNHDDGLPASTPGEQKIEQDFAHDTRGRLSSISWSTSADGSGAKPLLAEYGWAGALRRERVMHLGGSATPVYDSSYSWDAFDRLDEIVDSFSDTGTSSVVRNQFNYAYDAASNLIKEEYAKVDGSEGDRFAYDDFDRLTDAWLGQTDITSNHTGYVSGQMQAHLTYAFDGANNRTETTEQTASSGGVLSQAYTPEVDSNRYSAISEPAVGGGGTSTPYLYDDRGNLTCDGRFVYKYDYKNRLQEIWAIIAVLSQSSDGEGVVESQALQSEASDASRAGAASPVLAPRATTGDVYFEVSPGAFEEARRSVFESVPNLHKRYWRLYKDKTFVRRLRANIDGGIITMSGDSESGGMPSFVPAAGQLQLTAVFLYDGHNRRTVSTYPGILVWLHTYDDWREVAEYDLVNIAGSNFALPGKHFVWGSQLDELIGYRRKEAGGWKNYHILHGGQATSAKLVDEDGDIVEQYEYDPYGRVTVYDGTGTLSDPNGDTSGGQGTQDDGRASAVGLPFLWKGLRYDALVELCYMRNRFYSPGIGRFLTLDPIGVHGDVLNVGNGYGYVGDRVLVGGDAFGLQGKDGGAKSVINGGVVIHRDVQPGVGGGVVEATKEVKVTKDYVTEVERKIHRTKPRLTWSFSCENGFRFSLAWRTDVAEKRTTTTRTTKESLERMEYLILKWREQHTKLGGFWGWSTDLAIGGATAAAAAGDAYTWPWNAISRARGWTPLAGGTSPGGVWQARLAGAGFWGWAALTAGIAVEYATLAVLEERMSEVLEEAKVVRRNTYKFHRVEWDVLFSCDIGGGGK